MMSQFLMLALLMPDFTIKEEIPIANSVLDGEEVRSQKDTTQCINAARDLLQHVENLNGVLFNLEVDTSTYYVRHADRMAIISLIQNQLNPITGQINHGIYYSLPGGSGPYCEGKLKEGIDLSNRIYSANLEYRRVKK